MNLPGITTEHPNWRCQLPITRERFFKDERLRAGAGCLARGTADARCYAAPAVSTAPMRKALLACLLLIGAAVLSVCLLQPGAPPAGQRTTLAVARLLGEDDAGFARTDKPWPFRFPDDHGAHPAYRSEVWSFSGQLVNPQGRRFGFQLSFFRLALAPQAPPSPSAWATNQVYRGYFSLTDVEQKRFHAFERFSRAALGLSGATVEPVRVWVENWSMEVSEGRGAIPAFHLRAGEQDSGIDLNLRALKPVVTGEGGLLESDEGSPFYAYLVPRLTVSGTVQVGSDTYTVEGLAWLDRAWGRIMSPQGQLALNRFVLQLDDARELLIFQLHRRDGSGVPVNTGLWVESDGSVRRLERRDIAIDVLADWSSPLDDTRYPARWRVRVPADPIELDVVPCIDNQEVDLSVRYWGGAVRISGMADGRVLKGNGYAELTGYSKAAAAF